MLISIQIFLERILAAMKAGRADAAVQTFFGGHTVLEQDKEILDGESITFLLMKDLLIQ